jgi:hypothetical protein
MKGKIDENGWLWIERAGKLKKQLCPFSNGGDWEASCGDWCPWEASCGDWCPMFGDPYRYTLEKGIPATAIDICQAVLVFEEFEDERVEDTE